MTTTMAKRQRQRTETENKDIKKLHSKIKKSVDNALEDFKVQYELSAEKKERLEAARVRMKRAQEAAKMIQGSTGVSRAEALKVYYQKKLK